MIRTDVRLGWKSIPGHRHLIEGRENEDVLFASQEHPYFDAVMLIADGMGGHAEPRLAAHTAVSAARDYLFQPERIDELTRRRVDADTIVHRALELANRHVLRLGSRLEPAPGESGRQPRTGISAPVAGKGPGCTLTVAVVVDGLLAVAHVGDGSVLLLREGRLRALAGGESRRIGSRPEAYLGREDPIEIETASETARPGDRLLLCTDGLTRYFGDIAPGPGAQPPLRGRSEAGSGLERLHQVIARPTADPQTLATQLTADGRGEQYEDDTTVIVAEVGASREAPAPQPATARAGAGGTGGRGDGDRSGATPGGRQGESGLLVAPSPRRPLALSPLLPVAVALLAVAAALAWWRPWERGAGRSPGAFRPFSAPAVDLSALPKGGVLLVHPESGRLYVLRTRPVGTPAANEVLTLRELRYQAGGIKDTGNSYRLDARRGRLTSPDGRGYPVAVDGGSGLIEVQQGGTLRIVTQPEGLPVLIDGLAAGPSPVSAQVRAGRHQVQVLGARGRVLFDEPVEVPARTPVTIAVPPSLTRPAPGGSPR